MARHPVVLPRQDARDQGARALVVEQRQGIERARADGVSQRGVVEVLRESAYHRLRGVVPTVRLRREVERGFDLDAGVARGQESACMLLPALPLLLGAAASSKDLENGGLDVRRRLVGVRQPLEERALRGTSLDPAERLVHRDADRGGSAHAGEVILEQVDERSRVLSQVPEGARDR